MELWIRSQSRENLMKADDIVAVNNRILVYKDSNDCQTEVGEYKTKERALEVLDEIQRYLENNCLIEKEIYQEHTGSYMTISEYKIFQMPKE